jgi:hypothetical protein
MPAGRGRVPPRRLTTRSCRGAANSGGPGWRSLLLSGGRPWDFGELITDRRGTTAYLKTFRLSEKQVRRGYLLTRLAANDWNLADTATAMRISEADLGMRIQSAGFGALLRQDVLDRYRSRLRSS